MWPDQFEVRSALKTMAMVGRTRETSAISMRPVRKGKKAQACDHLLGGQRRCASAVVLEAHIVEAHRAGWEQRDRGAAPEHRIEARHGANFRFDSVAHGVRGHQKRQDHENANADNGQAQDNKCKTFDANGRGHDASFSSARRSTG
jgi:hypothetical protein